ncbi:O-antigen ligase family protein, partial [Clostridium sporogenes]|nr:O-antigen ligase family protein [Clostridium sporogenes]
MKKFGNFLSYIISVYIFILPILPSKFKYKNIPLNADVLLAVMIIIFMIAIIINKDIRKKFVYEIKT